MVEGDGCHRIAAKHRKARLRILGRPLGYLNIFLGLFPLTVTVTTRGNRNYNSPFKRPPLRTVTGKN